MKNFETMFFNLIVSFRDGWTCKGYKEDEESGEGQVTGTIFTDIDLTDMEWADYDEKADQSVCISDLEFQFVKVK